VHDRRLVIPIAVVALVGAGCGGAATASLTVAPTATPAASTPALTKAPAATPQASPAGPLGDGRQVQTATVLADGGVLVAGGLGLGDAPLASAVRYDHTTGMFSPTGPLATGRAFHTATLLSDGRVLITGGGPVSWGSGAGPFLASAEIYDPTTGTFSPTGSMATARTSHTATLLSDGRVLITGGADVQEHAVASAELYDPKSGTFSPTGSMTTARVFHTASLLSDGRVLIAGGDLGTWSYDGPFLASAEIYDPKTGTFNPTGSMTTSRAWHTATPLADGRVLITGGEHARTDLASAELYDPKTGTFSATGSMTAGRLYHAATRLSDGRVIVLGGGGDYEKGNFLAVTEIYDPQTGTFSATGSMTDARTYHAATLLADGRVLVTGGYGAAGPLPSAELYDPTTGTYSPTGAGG
jgi:hypothetical protein